MKKIFPILFVIAVITDTGCATVRVRTNAAQGSTEESTAKPVTLHRWFWGFVANSEYLVSSCPAKSLQEVHVKTKFWEGLVTVATLGIYAPVDVSWVCAKEEAPIPVPRR